MDECKGETQDLRATSQAVHDCSNFSKENANDFQKSDNLNENILIHHRFLSKKSLLKRKFYSPFIPLTSKQK